jgi:hypothetical protein
VLAGSAAIWVQGPRDVEALSTLKVVSFEELSVHNRSIRVAENATAERPPGAAGIVAVVVVPARFE